MSGREYIDAKDAYVHPYIHMGGDSTQRCTQLCLTVVNAMLLQTLAIASCLGAHVRTRALKTKDFGINHRLV